MTEAETLSPGTYPAHWYDTWDRNQSVAFTNTKGLRNAPGENNCFINSAVQVFWHLDVFRRSYRRLTGHLCMGNSCIFCALKVMFTQFQYSDQSSLPPDAIRKAMAETFANQQRFQLGHMDDAAECFENMLRRLHFHIANAHNEDACTAKHCLPHQKFAMTVFDQLVCPCGSSSDPLTFHEMVHYISASAFVSQSRLMRETGDVLHPDRFGLLLRNAGAVGDLRECPGNCGKTVQIRRTLLNSPDVVTIGMVWDSERPDSDLIGETVRSIGTTILLPDLFHSVMCDDVSRLPRLQLTALVCYYGKHYSTFVFHTKLKVWIYFDDATVKEVGPRWENVVEKCVRSRYQPLLLFYNNPNAIPIATETAPKKRVMAPGYSTPSKTGCDRKDVRTSHDVNCSAKRSVTPNPDVHLEEQANGQRAITPRPEHGHYNVPESLSQKPGIEHHRQPSFLIAVTGKTDKTGQRSQGHYDVPATLRVQNGNAQRAPEHMYKNGLVRQTLEGGDKASACRSQELDCVDDYNYTLSTSDQYRRPPLNGIDPVKLPLTLNFSRVADVQRKESFKKGRKVGADVIRYQLSTQSSSSESSETSPVFPEGTAHTPASPPCYPSGPEFPTSAPQPLPPRHVRSRSQSCEDGLGLPAEKTSTSGQHTVVKPKPEMVHNYENMDNMTHTPVESGLATLPRKKKGPVTGANQGAVQGDMYNHSRQNSVQEKGRQHSNNYQLMPDYQVKQMTGSHPPQNRQVASLTAEGERHSRQNSNSSTSSQQMNGYPGMTGGQGIPSNKPMPEAAQYAHGRQNSGTSAETDRHSRQSSNSSSSSQTPQHSRQSSGISQDRLSDRSSDSSQRGVGRAKADPSKSKLDKVSQPIKPLVAPVKNRPPPVPDKKRLISDFTDDTDMYIDRKKVESILNYQKLSRQSSSHSTVSQSSASSVDSDSAIFKGKGSVPCPKDNLSVEIPFDSVSMDSHKDSGYGSSDRNSSSSAGSVTMDPYVQYFMSRSMIPPKTINPQAFARFMDPSLNHSQEDQGFYEEKPVSKPLTKPVPEINIQAVNSVHQHHPPLPCKPQLMPGDLSAMSKEGRNHQIYEALKSRTKSKGSDGSSKSTPVTTKSQYPGEHENYMYYGNGQGQSQGQSTTSKQVSDQSRRNHVSAKDAYAQHMSHQMPIPENAPMPVGQSSGDGNDCYNFETPQRDILPGYNEVIGVGNEQFLHLCRRAEDLMDQCMLAETEEDCSASLSYCNSALECLKQAMKLPGVSQQSFAFAERKHNSCILKSRSLQKKHMTRQESSSSTSSNEGSYSDRRATSLECELPAQTCNGLDSGMNSGMKRDKTQDLHKPGIKPANPQHLRVAQQNRPPSRSSSHDSMDSLRDVHSSGSNSSINSIVQCGPSGPERSNGHVTCDTRTKYCDRGRGPVRNGASQEYSDRTRYRDTSDRGRHSKQNSSSDVNSDVHSDSASKQKQQIANLQTVRTSSGSSTPTPMDGRDTDSIRSDSSDQSMKVQIPTHQAKMNKAEIRTLLQQNISLRQQGIPPSYNPAVSSYASIGHHHPGLQTSESQPDLRSQSHEDLVPRRSLTPTPTVHDSSIEQNTEDFRPSVRDLASKFETVLPISAGKGQSEDGQTTAVASHRQRSKSESSSAKPKSVLAKNKKNRPSKCRKSVTFCDNIALIAATDNWQNMSDSVKCQSGYISDEEGTYGRMHDAEDEDSSESMDSPVECTGEGVCGLCSKKGVEAGQQYCAKCYHYMSRFMPPSKLVPSS